MNTDNKIPLSINNLSLNIIKKDIKNLHVSVLPPDGKVRVTAPLKMDDEAIRMAVISRIPWIKKQQAKFLNQDRQSIRDFVSGESHYYLGKPYRLKVISVNTKPKVYLKGKNQIILQITEKASFDKKQDIFADWYRDQLREILRKMLKKWEKKMDLEINRLGIRRMKTRWGSCNKENKTIRLNLELIKKPESSIEYVLVHELCHIFEKQHNENFIDLMTKYMPKWKIYKEELNRLPLAYEKWNY